MPTAITLTITDGRALVADGRLVAGESADVSVLGGVPAALYLVDAVREVVAACTSFVPGETSGTGVLDLATVPLAEIVADVPAGRAIPLQAIVEDAAGAVVGYGLVNVVSAPMPDALDPLDEDFIYAKLSDLQAYLTRSEADGRYAPIDSATPIAPSTDPSAEGKPADAYQAGLQLAAKLSRAEAVAGYTEWVCVPATYGGDPVVLVYNAAAPGWEPFAGGSQLASAAGDADSTSLTFTDAPISLSATRTRLRPTAAQEAAWDGKQASLTAQQLANIAAVPLKADAADLRYAIGVESTPDEQTGNYPLRDRAVNIVNTSAAAIVVDFPAAVSDRARDFFVYVDSSATGDGNISFEISDPTIGIATPDGDLPDIPKGAETILYFAEITPAWFLMRGEPLVMLSQS